MILICLDSLLTLARVYAGVEKEKLMRLVLSQAGPIRRRTLSKAFAVGACVCPLFSKTITTGNPVTEVETGAEVEAEERSKLVGSQGTPFRLLE
jgi:hypothetical protein